MSAISFASAKYSFHLFCNLPVTPKMKAALFVAGSIIKLQEKQALLSSKVDNVYRRLRKLELILYKINSKDSNSLKRDLLQLRTDIEALPEKAFHATKPKEKILDILSTLDKVLPAQSQENWKVDAIARLTIAGGIGVYFATHPEWVQSNSAAALLAKPYFDLYGSKAHWGAGLTIGIVSMACAYGFEKTALLLIHQAIRVSQGRNRSL